MTALELQYLTDISSALSDYSSEFAVREQRNMNVYRTREIIKLILLQAYVEIMSVYLQDTMTGDTNFFTTSEAEDVMQRINDITKGNYWLDLS